MLGAHLLGNLSSIEHDSWLRLVKKERRTDRLDSVCESEK